MKGKYHIVVQNEYLKYEFDLRRNLTIIKGDSATGKTTLIEMIQEFLINGEDSGISLSCEVECRVLTGNLWKGQLSEIKDSIVFIDEGNRFVVTKDFAEMVKNSNNYYVIVTRENIETLPVSVDEIYGIRSSGKYGSLNPVYHQLYRIYNFDKSERFPIKPEAVIVEDSNSGYDFFKNVSENSGITCISAKGKSNIYSIISRKKIEEDTVLIADGAAFGFQMNRLEYFVKTNKNIHLYLPESFEWLLLKSGVIRDVNLKEVLEQPSDYIESQDFFSWEQYFTSLLIEISRGSYLEYSKKKLNPNYLQGKIKNKILHVIEGIIF